MYSKYFTKKTFLKLCDNSTGAKSRRKKTTVEKWVKLAEFYKQHKYLPSITMFAKYCECETPTMVKALKRLRDGGYLTITLPNANISRKAESCSRNKEIVNKITQYLKVGLSLRQSVEKTQLEYKYLATETIRQLYHLTKKENKK